MQSPQKRTWAATCQAFSPCRALPGAVALQPSVGTLSHARPPGLMSYRPFLVNQHFHHIWSICFSFLLSEKLCRHDIIFKEPHFHLSSLLRSFRLLHPPSHSQVLSCAPAQHYPMWIPTRTSHAPHTQLHLPSQGADPCMEAELMSSSAPWCCSATCPSSLPSGMPLLGLWWDLSHLPAGMPCLCTDGHKSPSP